MAEFLRLLTVFLGSVFKGFFMTILPCITVIAVLGLLVHSCESHAEDVVPTREERLTDTRHPRSVSPYKSQIDWNYERPLREVVRGYTSGERCVCSCETASQERLDELERALDRIEQRYVELLLERTTEDK